MDTINLVQGDLTPVIRLTVEGIELTGKALRFSLRPRNSCDRLELDAMLQEDGSVHVPLTATATAVPGIYLGQLEVVGEQTLYDQVLVNIRGVCA